MTTYSITYPPKPKANRAELPPGPPELPIVGQSFRYIRNPVGLMQEAATYGDLSTMSVKPALVYLASHPEIIRQLFVVNHPSVGRDA